MSGISGARLEPAIACQAEPRCSSYGYIPDGADDRVAVVVHGSDRDPKALRDAFIPWAAANRCAVLAPLFPGGLGDPDDVDGYKSVRFRDIDFDRVLLAMLNEFAARNGLTPGRLLLFGFSGGAQFVHRFVLLHPQRVRAASIAAPGNVTLIGDARPWWVGTGDFAERFGRPIDLAALGDVRIQTVIGSDDDGRDVIRVQPHEARWVDGANDSGVTRRDRLRSLERDWRAHGVPVTSRVVDGARHEVTKLIPVVLEFFTEVLRVP